jgi:CMP-N-acetylneuraminic acid synthetase
VNLSQKLKPFLANNTAIYFLEYKPFLMSDKYKKKNLAKTALSKNKKLNIST